MKRLCIIPCGKKKIWDVIPEVGPTIAKQVYISPFGKACQEYASTFFCTWVVLSAKHGFLFPDDVVDENYDLAFDSKDSKVITGEELYEQMIKKQLIEYDEVVVLGGKKHYRVVENLYPKEKLTFPLQGLKGIGYMLQRLNRAVEEEKEI
ncbi:DUF6884 domain-containing protein [Priestia taiwanensis]|uniref:DUF6884 domain-containing protein n=1 Tax=Priestia taiwanensis TaxID=1347902 RepID=A0A917AMW0_9BACI|nr:DUF6884 domain-containing protein [Priestia taiwanensis]MBM7362239.1 hypothetical protein [Priestia taiwanensis]GGE60547.1 hypothetical protein GCM10007140_08600 [Priestia taiwanensis]